MPQPAHKLNHRITVCRGGHRKGPDLQNRCGRLCVLFGSSAVRATDLASIFQSLSPQKSRWTIAFRGVCSFCYRFFARLLTFSSGLDAGEDATAAIRVRTPVQTSLNVSAGLPGAGSGSCASGQYGCKHPRNGAPAACVQANAVA
jgi:hypothetical protein